MEKNKNDYIVFTVDGWDLVSRQEPWGVVYFYGPHAMLWLHRIQEMDHYKDVPDEFKNAVKMYFRMTQ